MSENKNQPLRLSSIGGFLATSGPLRLPQAPLIQPLSSKPPPTTSSNLLGLPSTSSFKQVSPLISSGFSISQRLTDTRNEIQLDDLLPEYPDQDDKDIQRKLTALHEFSELSATPIEEVPKRGQYFKHQLANQRFMEHYDRELIMHDTGTGKSCVVFAITERLRKLYGEDRSRIRKYVFITPNKVLTREAKNQLVYLCSDEGVFDTEIKDSKGAKDSKGKSANKQTRILSAAGYEFTTHESFANKVNRALDPKTLGGLEDFIAEYCNTYFFLDEVDRTTPKRLFMLKLDNGLPVEDRAFIAGGKRSDSKTVVGSTTTKGKKTKDPTKNKVYHYKMIWTAFHILPGVKIMIGSATPMNNEPQQIGMVMNLILPLNKQMPVSGTLYDNLNPNDRNKLEQFAPYFLGKVSYVRALDTGLDVVDIGELSGYNIITGQKMDVKVKVYVPRDYDDPSKVIALRGAQLQAYKEALQSENIDQKNDKDRSDGASSGLRQKSRIAADFVFPGRSEDELPVAGNEGFDRWIEEKKVTKTVNMKTREGTREVKETRYTVSPIFMNMLKSGIDEKGDYKGKPYPYLVNLSTKYFAIAELEIDAYRNGARINILNDAGGGDIGRSKDDSGKQLPGSAFIYSPEIFGSGSFVLGLVLEAYGFTKYDGKTEGPLFEIKNGVHIPRKDKKPRYCLFTGSAEITGPKAEENMLNAMNSPLNANGEYLQIFIASKVGSVGINVANIVRLHLTGPDWTMASEYQALSRGIRSTSHLALVEQQKKYLAKRGQDPDKMSQKYLELLGEYKAIENTPAGSAGEQAKTMRLQSLNQQLQFYKASRVRVEIYRHAVYAPGLDSADISGYEYAERRYKPIKTVERYMKICAWDAQLNYKRNVRPTDEEGSAICDFTTCGYKTYNDPPTEKDFTAQNFNILYADKLIDTIKSQISDILRERFEVRIDILINMIKASNSGRNYGDISIIMALEELYSDSVTGKAITDRYGFKTYVHQDGLRIFLHSTPPGLSQKNINNSSLSVYTQYLIGLGDKTLQDEIKSQGLQRQQAILSEIKSQPSGAVAAPLVTAMAPPLSTGMISLENLTLDDRVNIIERIFQQYQPNGYDAYYWPIYVMNPPNNVLNIINANKQDIFVMNQLQVSYIQLYPPKKHRDEKNKYDVPLVPPDALQNEQIPIDRLSPLVVIHKIYTLEKNEMLGKHGHGSSARAKKAEGRLRIIRLEHKNPEMNRWTDVPQNEYPAYNRALQIIYYRRNLQNIRKWGSGMILDNKFKILTMIKPEKRADGRSYSGRECVTEDRSWTLLHMYESGFPLPQNPAEITNAATRSRNQLLDELMTGKSGFKGEALNRLSTYNDEGIRHIYVLNNSYRNKPDLCKAFEEYLRSQGLLTVA